MIFRPRVGMRVQVWYAKAFRPVMRHHASEGVVTIIPRPDCKAPINVGVRLDSGVETVIPRGNLRCLGPKPRK